MKGLSNLSKLGFVTPKANIVGGSSFYPGTSLGSDLVAGYDFTNAANVDTTTNPPDIDSIVDLSSNGWDVSQTTASLKPAYNTNPINGYATGSPYGADDYLGLSDGSVSYADAAGALYFIARHNSGGYVFSFGGTGNGNRMLFGFNSGKLELTIRTANASGTQNTREGDTVSSVGDIVVGYISYNGSVHALSVNGVAQTITDSGSGTGNWASDCGALNTIGLFCSIRDGVTIQGLSSSDLAQVWLVNSNFATYHDDMMAYLANIAGITLP